MNRREIIVGLGSTAVWPLAARAQQRERIRYIGVFIDLAADDPESARRIVAFTQRLAELGWSEGRNVRFEFRFGAGDAARFRGAATELVALAPDIILAHGGPMTGLLQQATGTTPIVFVNTSDPVTAGYVASLARPGGNVTGFSPREFGFAADRPEFDPGGCNLGPQPRGYCRNGGRNPGGSALAASRVDRGRFT